MRVDNYFDSFQTIQASTGDNSAIHGILESILSTGTAVGEAFKDEVNAQDMELIFYAKELLQ